MPSLNVKEIFLENIKKLIGFKITKMYKQRFFDIIENLDDVFIIEFNDGDFAFHIQCITRIRKKDNIILTSNDDFIDSDYNTLDNNDNNNDNLMKKQMKKVSQEIMKYNIINCQISELGDLTIFFESEYCIDIFIDVPKNAELYRFIIKGIHYVISQKNGEIKFTILKNEVYNDIY